jgi:hydroxymethylpyrimidine pyrophosphatase-like HAD family hydrolase
MYQTPFKVSYDIVDPATGEMVREELIRRGVDARVIVTHGSKMDIIPAAAGKGVAIGFLRDRLGIDPDRVVVAGDSANDVDMFTGQNRGIVVANADPELMTLDRPQLYRASASHAAGVLEGLRYWNVI